MPDTATYTQPVIPGLEAVGATLETLRASNADKYEQLQRPDAGGRRAIPDPLGVLALRVGLLIETLLPAAPDRNAYELAFEEKMGPLLDQCLAQRNQQYPAAGPAVRPSGLVIPGIRETGG
jgi:hypothetical protein